MMKKNKEGNRREREKGLSEATRRPVTFWYQWKVVQIGAHTHTQLGVFRFAAARAFNFKCGLTVSVVLRLFVCLFVKWGKKVVRYQMKGGEDSRCFYVSIFIIQTIKRIFSLQFIWMDLMKIPRRLVYFFLPRAIPLLFVFYPWLN